MGTSGMQGDETGAKPRFTDRQGQYLAFIHAYTLINDCPPAEADMQRFFRVSGPAAHSMVVTLENAGLLTREPRMGRSILLTIDPATLPRLERGHNGPIYLGTAGRWVRSGG